MTQDSDRGPPAGNPAPLLYVGYGFPATAEKIISGLLSRNRVLSWPGLSAREDLANDELFDLPPAVSAACFGTIAHLG